MLVKIVQCRNQKKVMNLIIILFFYIKFNKMRRIIQKNKIQKVSKILMIFLIRIVIFNKIKIWRLFKIKRKKKNLKKYKKKLNQIL